MTTTYKNLKEFRHKNGLPRNLVVEMDGYGLYNTVMAYGILCLHNKRYINTFSKIDFRKLINNGNGVLDNVSKLVETTLSEIMSQLPEGSTLSGKHMAILMGVSGGNNQICCIHKFKDQDNLRTEFEYIFKSIVKRHKDNLHDNKQF